MIVLAHGVGGRSDLPAPLTVTLLGAGTAVLFSFLALHVLWLTPRLQGTRGQALPARVTALLDAPATVRRRRHSRWPSPPSSRAWPWPARRGRTATSRRGRCT